MYWPRAVSGLGSKIQKQILRFFSVTQKRITSSKNTHSEWNPCGFSKSNLKYEFQDSCSVDSFMLWQSCQYLLCHLGCQNVRPPIVRTIDTISFQPCCTFLENAEIVSKYEQMRSKLSSIWNLIRSRCCHPLWFVPLISLGMKHVCDLRSS